MNVNWKEVGAYLRFNARSFYREAPVLVYAIILLITVCFTLYYFSLKEGKQETRMVTSILLIDYIIFVFCSTVILRPIHDSYVYNFAPFWSYRAFFDGSSNLISSIIINILIFMPIGFLSGFSFMPASWRSLIMTVLGISCSIEVLQFVLRRGFAEFDDVFHNLIGGIIGYCIFKVMNVLRRKTNNRTGSSHSSINKDDT